MSDMKMITDMLAEMRETSVAQQIELTRLNTAISIEIPAIKDKFNDLSDSEDRISALERYGYENRQAISKITTMQDDMVKLHGQVKDLGTSMDSMNQSIQAMKPVIQFFTFVKWLSVGIVMILGWVGSNAMGIWDFIEKLFHK